MGKIISIAVAFLAFPIVCFPDRDRPDPTGQARFAIELNANADGSFRLTTAEAPVQKIIERIAGATHTVLNFPQLPVTLATVSCSGRVIELMKCVLGDAQNLMMRYGDESASGSGTDDPVEIWVLPSSSGPLAPGIEAQASGVCGAPQFAGDACSDRIHSGKTEMLSEQERHALVERLSSRDLPARTEAITRLERSAMENEPEVVALLQEALKDEHPAVRAQAVSALAANRAPGVDQMLRQAFNDPDANVRLVAVGYAGEDESLLLAALNDADRNVRLLAEMNLEQLYKQEDGDH